MVKKFTVNCDFGGQKHPVTLYIGDPSPDSHPLGFQGKWLSKERGGSIPSEIMDSFAKLKEISEKNRVPFEELCSYVINEINSKATLSTDAKDASVISKKKKGES